MFHVLDFTNCTTSLSLEILKKVLEDKRSACLGRSSIAEVCGVVNLGGTMKDLDHGWSLSILRTLASNSGSERYDMTEGVSVGGVPGR
jgi:hypothetical protein